MKIKCPYCKKEITTNNTFSGGMVFCDFCNHNFFLQIKRSAFPHYLIYAILVVVCVVLGYGCIKWNQRYNGFLADEKANKDIWVAEKEQLGKRIDSIVAEKNEELDKLNKIIVAHEITIQQQTEKESLDNSNYQKTIDILESTRDKLLIENKNLLNENEQLIKQLGNATKQEKTNMVIQQKVNPKTTVSESMEETLDMLLGIYYDLRRPTTERDALLKKLPNVTPKPRSQKTMPDMTERKELYSILSKFVLGKWDHSFDKNGFPVYSDLQQYYRYPLEAYSSLFFLENTPSTTMMNRFNDENASAFGWFSIHSGYVIAPFTGQFRFVGCGDDALVVRFNQRLVLDYGFSSLSLGKDLSGPEDCVDPNTTGRRLLSEKGLYSDKLEVYFPDSFNKHGVAKGLPINVTKGKVYPIEILSSDAGGNYFSIALFVERLDSNGKPLNENPARLPLFRTSSKTPHHPSTVYLPDFDENSPIWKVVDSKGKPIPLRTDLVADVDNIIFSPMAQGLLGMKQTSFGSSVSSQGPPISAQQKSDPNPKKTISTTKQDNVTTSRELSTTKTSSGNKPESSSSRIIQTPFGSTQRPVEDEE